MEFSLKWVPFKCKTRSGKVEGFLIRVNGALFYFGYGIAG